MPSVADIYNRLPTVEAADKAFTSRAETLDAVRILLGTYGHKFGLCLVHAHCLLDEGEIMLSRGTVSEPELLCDVVEHFPERWLASGQPYEFTTRPTSAPPAALLDAFREIVGDSLVLGLYHIDQEENGGWIEHTEGRKNILTLLADEGTAPGAAGTIMTAWDFGSFNPVTRECQKFMVCDSTETKSGGSYHKDTKSEIHGKVK